MDARQVSLPGLDAAAADMIADYLLVLDSHLPVGRRARRQIVAELLDGLGCAVEQYVHDGVSPVVAARRAMDEFGDPSGLAAQFASQLGPIAAHRIGVRLVAGGPLVGLTWLAAYADTGPDLPARLAAVLNGVPQLAVILAVTVPAAIVAATGAGWPGRLVRLPSRLVTGAAVLAAIGCAAGDLSLIVATLIAHRMAVDGPVSMAMAAVVVSVVRLTTVCWAGSRVGRLRAAGR
jgi:hypothetical protein